MAIYSDEKIEFIQRSKRSKPLMMDTSHFHDKHELYYLEKGKTRYFIGNEIYLLNPGDMVFVPKGTFHKTNPEESTVSERVLLVFDNDFAGEEYKKYIDGLKQNKFIQLPSEQIYIIRELCQKIEHENKHRNADYLEMEKLYLRQLLIIISRYRLKDSNTKFTESFKVIQDAAKYISQNYGSEITLQTMAEKYAMSASYFSKQFKAITGVGFNEYINLTRITAAEKLLAKADKPITEVAMECGFNDSNYFAAVFKKIRGITPKKFSMQSSIFY
ncbi:MAG: helix-turn-helix transcriptional regulator [Clostridia bacterium]|nr:helix-turn-helix transcriptional regulator [Clostridia bacterium]